MNGPIVIYGATRCGRVTFDILNSKCIPVSYFCDDNPKIANSKIKGIDIIPLKSLKHKVSKSPNLIICSTTESSIEKMKHNCSEEHFNNVFYFPDLTIDYTNSTELKKYEREIDKLFTILEDTSSRDIVESVLRLRLSGSYDNINNQNVSNDNGHYFPEEIVKLSKDEIFIDAGAYNGDTILEFLNKVDNSFCQIHAFEIDKDNYEQLMQTISSLSDDGVDINNIVTNKAGVYDKNGTLYIENGLDQSSFISEDGEVSAPIITIDSYIEDKAKPTFIKMDIEGAEINALYGAEKTIKLCKPTLAICLYHLPEHIWQIPLYIKELVPEYKIYIRAYQDLKETICYATI